METRQAAGRTGDLEREDIVFSHDIVNQTTTVLVYDNDFPLALVRTWDVVALFVEPTPPARAPAEEALM